MNRFLAIAVLYIIFFPPLLIAGQFYQYKDTSGALIFTDDLSQVPKDQQPEVKLYEAVQNKEMDSQGETANDLKSDSVDSRSKVSEKDRSWYDQEEKRLNREKKGLVDHEKRSEYG